MAVGCHTYIWAELNSLFKKEHWSGNVDLADTDRSARGGTDWLAGRSEPDKIPGRACFAW